MKRLNVYRSSLNLNGQKGFTLAELVITVGISLVVVLFLSVAFGMFIHQIQGLSDAQENLRGRTQVAFLLENDTAIANTMADQANGAFVCLTNPLTCPTTFTAVQILDENKAISPYVLDPVAAAKNKTYNGLNFQEQPCTSTQLWGDSVCRFQARVYWRMICDATCANPQIEWKAEFSDAGGQWPKMVLTKFTFLRRTNATPAALVAGVASGPDFSCAWYKDGRAKCWGANVVGQLGSGVFAATQTPQWVLNAAKAQLTGIASIAQAQNVTCALMQNKTVQCWGLNRFNELGQGYATSTNPNGLPYSPGPVLKGPGSPLTNVTILHSGRDGGCATVMNGTQQLWCWGWEGPIVGTHTDVPAFSIDFDTWWPWAEQLTSVASGLWLRYVSPTLPPGGTNAPPNGSALNVWNTTDSSIMPTAGWVDMTQSDIEECMILSPLGELTCWGEAQWGRMGEGSADNATPQYFFINANNRIQDVGQPPRTIVSNNTTPTTNNLQGVVAIAPATQDFECVQVKNTAGVSQVACWGGDWIGELGHPGVLGAGYTPAWVVDATGVPLTGVQTISGNNFNVCVTNTTGQVYCWGDNTFGQLGVAHADCSSSQACSSSGIAVCHSGLAATALPTNTKVDYGTHAYQIPLPFTAKSVAVGTCHVCATSTAGQVYCWGDNSLGQFGNGPGAGSIVPVQVKGL